MFNKLDDGVRILSLRQLRDPDSAVFTTSIPMDNASSYGGSKAGSVTMISHKYRSPSRSNTLGHSPKYNTPPQYGPSLTHFSPPDSPSKYNIGAPSFTESYVTEAVPEVPTRVYTGASNRRSRRYNDEEMPLYEVNLRQ